MRLQQHHLARLALDAEPVVLLRETLLLQLLRFPLYQLRKSSKICWRFPTWKNLIFQISPQLLSQDLSRHSPCQQTFHWTRVLCHLFR